MSALWFALKVYAALLGIAGAVAGAVWLYDVVMALTDEYLNDDENDG